MASAGYVQKQGNITTQWSASNYCTWGGLTTTGIGNLVITITIVSLGSLIR